MQRTVVERTTCNQGVASTLVMLKRPINPVSERFVLVESFRYLVTSIIREQTLFRPITPRVKADDFETIVHARDKEVILTFGGWMPLDPPGSTSDIHIC